MEYEALVSDFRQRLATYRQRYVDLDRWAGQACNAVSESANDQDRRVHLLAWYEAAFTNTLFTASSVLEVLAEALGDLSDDEARTLSRGVSETLNELGALTLYRVRFDPRLGPDVGELLRQRVLPDEFSHEALGPALLSRLRQQLGINEIYPAVWCRVARQRLLLHEIEHQARAIQHLFGRLSVDSTIDRMTAELIVRAMIGHQVPLTGLTRDQRARGTVARRPRG